MSHVIGIGRYGRETYPEAKQSGPSFKTYFVSFTWDAITTDDTAPANNNNPLPTGSVSPDDCVAVSLGSNTILPPSCSIAYVRAGSDMVTVGMLYTGAGPFPGPFEAACTIAVFPHP